ncbi:MAG: hypothetical protein JJU33_06780 [Phycisphaerales bacterium]|nr:hypothetical protein [Phycisphaerales bacterium]
MTSKTARRTRRFSLRSLRVRITILAIVVLALPTAFLVSGCGATIRPPHDPQDPVSIYLIDYGRHTGIVLPRDEPRTYVEYHYGEWAWFAENRAGPLSSVRAMVFPSRGTLGRREHSGTIDEQTLARSYIFDTIYTLTVGAAEAGALRDRLDNRFDSAIETETYNPRQAMHFVHDEKSYTFWGNCNPVLAGWLRELGCEVRGPALLANWRIEED